MFDLTHPVRRWGHANIADYLILLAESRSPLWISESSVENLLQFGKIQNLRKASYRLHTTEIPAGAVFSFWKQIGKAKRSLGYAVGRELRHGCLIPTIGGGLCQLSNALYDLALKCGCEIVERHAHTAVVPGSSAEHGRDATIFWNYVDFRFRAQQDILIKACVSRTELIVSFWGKHPQISITGINNQHRKSMKVNTCTDCEALECFSHMPAVNSKNSGRSAFLIEECWPEFAGFAKKERFPDDELFLPFHSRFAQRARYRWETGGYSRVVSGNFPTIISAMRARLAPRGAPVIAHQLSQSEALACYYGARLSLDVSRFYVAQTLLAFLWRKGHLGGRNFSVFMTRLPLAALHRQLDDLAVAFPERKTFQEFRAPEWMVEAEAEALDEADNIVTPHNLLATLFPSKTIRLEWKLPLAKSSRKGQCIVFPGPAVARKGAYELRESLRAFDNPLLVLNTHAPEAENFWDGNAVTRASGDWLEQAAIVVAPAFFENNPRPLLKALAAGIPVIATRECGIGAHPLLTLIAAGDSDALANAMQKIISPARR